MGVSNWQELFRAWPADLARRGILLTTWGEQVPFDGFLTNDTFLLISRQTPDSLGSRMIILPFDQIVGIKMTEVLRPRLLQPLGFMGTLPSR